MSGEFALRFNGRTLSLFFSTDSEIQCGFHRVGFASQFEVKNERGYANHRVLAHNHCCLIQNIYELGNLEYVQTVPVKAV